MDSLPMRVAWKSALVQSGAQCVMTSGALLMLKWPVHSWDTQEQVCEILFHQKNLYTYWHFCSSGAQAFSFAFFGQGTGPIHIDNVRCLGTETRLLSCPLLRVDNCVHAEDAGIRCQGCATGDIRLVGGSSASEGRVEFCQGSTWGTVCDDLWGVPDARVVCRQLGFSTFNPVARTNAFFGAGTGQILLDNVRCAGTEARLEDCPYITMHNCVHAEDAGVTCVATRKN